MIIHCQSCGAALIEIDHYGERLVGCNRWGWKGTNLLFMLLPEEDIEALRGVETDGRQARSV
jgi:hypothetical protein